MRVWLESVGTARDNWYWWVGGFLFAFYMMVSGGVVAMSVVYKTQYKPLTFAWVWYIFLFFGYVGLCVALSVGRGIYEKDKMAGIPHAT